MSERKDIDHLAREGTNQTPPFSYKEEHWMEAATMLDEAAKVTSSGSRWRIGWIILGVVGIIASGITYMATRNANNPITAKSGQQQVLAMALPEFSNDFAAVSSNQNTDRGQKQVEGSSPQSDITPVSENVINRGSNSSRPSQDNITNRIQEDHSQKQQGERDEFSMTQDGTNKSLSNLNTYPNQGHLDSDEETSAKELEANKEETLNGSSLDVEVLNSDSEKIDEPESEQSPVSLGQKQRNVAYNQANEQSIPAVSWFSLEHKELGSLGTEEAILPSLYRDIDVQDQLEKRHQGSKWSVWVAFAARFTQTWDADKNIGVSPYLGVGVSYRFTPRLSLSTGIYTYMRANESLVKTESVRQYSFGVDRVSYGQQLNRVYFAGLPLTIQYLVHPRHQLGLGGQLNYTVSSYSEALTDWPGNIELQPESAAGYQYMDGIARMDVGLHVNYRYLFNDLWSVWMQLDYGVGPVIKSGYYNQEVSGRNHGISIGLRHELK